MYERPCIHPWRAAPGGTVAEAADGAGVNVAATRYQALMLSGALMGVAGAFLSMAQFNAFTFGVISVRQLPP